MLSFYHYTVIVIVIIGKVLLWITAYYVKSIIYDEPRVE